jgi:Ca2+-binding EF-hand superfamily protein
MVPFIFFYILWIDILQALASTIDEEELADLKDQFDAIDVDKNGAISLEEMRQVVSFYQTVICFSCKKPKKFHSVHSILYEIHFHVSVFCILL